MTRYPISCQNGGKMAKIDTLFMTKTAENPTLWGGTYLYSPYKGVPPSPGKIRGPVGKFFLRELYPPPPLVRSVEGSGKKLSSSV